MEKIKKGEKEMKKWKLCLIWLLCFTLLLPSGATIAYASQETESVEVTRTSTWIEQYEAEAKKILDGMESNWSDLEKALYLNDYLAINSQYDLTYSKYYAYNIIVEKTGVCQAYAEAYKDLANRAGLTCEVVTSQSLNHAWNVVKIKGKYYHVDVTWNDPVADQVGRARHQYFMKSSQYFMSAEGGHLEEYDWQITGNVDITTVTSTTYDDYFWNDIDVGFQYYDGSWYSLTEEGDAIARYTCNGKKFTKKEEILPLNFKWYLNGGMGSYWVGYFGGLGLYGNHLYYASSTEIYAYNLKTKKSEVVYKLTSKEKKKGNIYGMSVSPDGKITYALSTSPNETGTLKETDALSDETVNQITYKIAFVGNGSTSGKMSSITCKSDVAKKLSVNKFKRKGYTFTGWNTKADGSGKSYKDKAKVKNLTSKNGKTVKLYAQWKKTKYKVTYKLNGGKNNSKNPTSYYVTTSTKMLKNPTKVGYVFKGWYSDSDFKKKVTQIKKGSTGNKTLYAKWQAIKYDVVFDGNGATSGEMKELSNRKYGKTYTLKTNTFEREGYTFVGWNTKADGSGKSYTDKAKIKNLTSKNGKTITLYAQWEKKES